VDGHNWMFSVAYGFFESESKESWTWFLLQLRKAIGEPNLLAIHSDACKGLTEAIKDVFPNAERRECFRHLMQNYVKQWPGTEHMYPTARAYRPEVYEHHKLNIVGIDGVAVWLEQ
jgi:hypothetical protein